KDKCNGKGGWKDFLISNKDSSLGRFLVGMGYDVDKELNGTKTGGEIFGPLSSLFNGPLEKLYNVSKKYFTSFSSRSHVPSSDSQPKTVREILLWLSGLPFIPQFPKLLKHCERLCLATGNPVEFNDFDKFKTSLYASCLRSPFVLAAIQWPGKSEIFYHNFSEISESLYPEDPSDLLDMLLENVRKIFVPLKFLCMQCERKAAEAGWQNCYFGSKCKTDGKFSSPDSPCCSTADPDQGYLCTASGSNQNVHLEHCWGGKCIGSDSSSCNGKHNSGGSSTPKCTPCPHPLLRFLVATSDSKSKDSSPFQPPEGFPPMGFDSSKLSPTGRSGESLFVILDIFVGESNTNEKVCFLRDLLRFLLCLTRTPPSTLGELFGFFKVFVPKLDSKFVPYASKEPGRPDGQKFTNALKDALETLKGSSHSGSHPYDLRSLIDCSSTKDLTCGKYLYSLTGDVYDIFIDSPGMYLSWICYLPKDFKTLLEEFKQKFSDCCSSGSSCKSIVKCPCALPLIYSQGFQFHSPNSLNTNNKKCSDFTDQVEKVAGEGSPLQKLLDAIEEFIWSIRLPFFLFVLAFWAFVISYFLYVQLYKLDVLELNSHDHPAWSFKILPSTLFSDASSRLKDLSYFSL
ncbi:variant erythrocyte surface antigen-1 family protein, partial [Babesia divergens]